MIPAGTVWGGNPARFVRNLTEQELLNNYAKSYNEGADQFEGDQYLTWPNRFDSNAIGAGEQSLEDYAHEKYFQVRH